MEAGITDNLHFYTDKNFNCGKYREFENVRLYNMVGADLAEKGKILLITAEIFSDTPKVFYYSPFESELPCALYLPELNSLIASGYNAYSAERLSCRSFDVGSILDETRIPLVEKIAEYTMDQSRTYMMKSLDLIGIADLLLKEFIKNGSELLRRERLTAYAARKAASLLEKREGTGSAEVKSVSAITCHGYCFAGHFENYRVIRLCDNYISASRVFVQTFSKIANRFGYDTILSRAVDSEFAPMHLMIPEAKLMFVSEQSMLFGIRFPEASKINLERYYSRELLESREHGVTFYCEYIRKLYNEAATCARVSMDIKNQGRKLIMPFISEKKTDEIASEIISCILNS